MPSQKAIDGLHEIIQNCHEYDTYTHFVDKVFTYIYMLNNHTDYDVERLRDIFYTYLKDYFADEVKVERFVADDFAGFKILNDKNFKGRYTEALVWVKNNRPLFEITYRNNLWKWME